MTKESNQGADHSLVEKLASPVPRCKGTWARPSPIVQRSPLARPLHWTWKWHLPFFSSSKQQISLLSIRNSHAYPYARNRYCGYSYALNQGIYLNYTLVHSVEGIGWKPFFRVGKPPKFYLEVIRGSQPLVSSKEVEIVDGVCTWKEKLPL